LRIVLPVAAALAFALVATAAGLAAAHPSLKATMRDWKAGLATLQSQIEDGKSYRAADVALLATRIGDDAAAISTRLHGAGPRAADVKQRFETLAADVRALADATSRGDARARFEAARATCIGCHDAYAH